MRVPSPPMKKLLTLLSPLLLFLWGGHQYAIAQQPVTTGIVRNVDPQKGLLTVLSDQTRQPISYAGADRANIYTVDGKPALLTDLQQGTPVTVTYFERGNAFYVDHIVFGEVSTNPRAAAAPAVPPGVMPAGGLNPTGYPDPHGRVEPLNTTNRPQ